MSQGNMNHHVTLRYMIPGNVTEVTYHVLV